MEMHKKVERSNCPQCGQDTYLVCYSNLELIEEEKFDFCTSCGYPDTRSEPVPGLCCLKSKNGNIRFYSISGDTTSEIVSWFRSVLRDPDIDPNGSYLNKWDSLAKTIER